VTDTPDENADIVDGFEQLLKLGVVAQARFDPEGGDRPWQVRYVTDRGYEVRYSTEAARGFVTGALLAVERMCPWTNDRLCPGSGQRGQLTSWERNQESAVCPACGGTVRLTMRMRYEPGRLSVVLADHLPLEDENGPPAADENPTVSQLLEHALDRYLNDAVFHARVETAVQILDRMGPVSGRTAAAIGLATHDFDPQTGTPCDPAQRLRDLPDFADPLIDRLDRIATETADLLRNTPNRTDDPSSPKPNQATTTPDADLPAATDSEKGVVDPGVATIHRPDGDH